MKKSMIFLAILPFLFIGCGVSNWNLGNKDVNVYEKKDEPKPAEKTIDKTPPKDESIDFEINEPIEEDIDFTKLSEAVNEQNATIQADSNLDINSTAIMQEEERSGNYHITTIIKTWGEPTSKKPNGIYVWKNCKPTGDYEEICDANSCQTVPKTSCCDRELKTDEAGYVTNLKEAIAACK